MTKPVRRVKSNGRTITGTFASPKTGKLIQYESHLEYTFIQMLEFDSQVVDIFDQPLTINYEHGKRDFAHTPDFLVLYKHRKPVIFECKYQSEIDADDGSIARNLKAGKSYAKANEREYRIITDKSILTTYSNNVDELLKVRDEIPDLRYTSKIVTVLRELKISTPHQLAKSITTDLDERAVILRQLRILMLKRVIVFDIFGSALKGDTVIRLARKNTFNELRFPYNYA